MIEQTPELVNLMDEIFEDIKAIPNLVDNIRREFQSGHGSPLLEIRDTKYALEGLEVKVVRYEELERIARRLNANKTR